MLMLGLVKAVFLISLVVSTSEPQDAAIDFAPRTVVAQSGASGEAVPAEQPGARAEEAGQEVGQDAALQAQAPAYPPMTRPSDEAYGEVDSESDAFAAPDQDSLTMALARDDAGAAVAASVPGAGGVSDDALAQASFSSAASGLPRLLGASVAYAADLPAMPDIVPPAPSFRNTPPPADTGTVRPDENTSAPVPTPAVSPFVSRDSAAQRQAELNRREQELLALQQQMESRMGELHNLENRLQGMLHDASTTQEGKMQQLIQMYANMKPRVAAQALSTMDESIAVRILTGMKSKQSGEILSYMDPRNAARLSEVMSKMQM